MQRAKPFIILATLATVLPLAGSLLSRAEATAQPFVSGGGGPAGHLAGHAAATGEPKLVCFGDSLTAGAGLDPNEAFPAVLQQRLDHEGYHYRVVNQGVSGNTTKDGVDRLRDVLREHAQVIVVEFGGNDGLRGLPTEQAERNLDLIVRTLKNSGAKVALAGITLPAQYGGPYVQSFNAMFTAVAQRNHVPLLPFILQDVYGVPGDIQDDGIHPTAQGAQQVAVNVEHLVQPLLKK